MSATAQDPVAVLTVAPLPPFLMQPLRAAFAVHERLHETDPAAFERIAPSIRAIAGHGESQVPRALLERLPALEIVSIMGVGYDKPVVQWSKGEYANASNTQDDLAVIAAGGAPVITDEAGSTVGTESLQLAGGSDLALGAGAQLNATAATVASGSTLTLAQGANFGYQTLAGNGTVNAAQFANAPGSTVSGSLTFTGDYTNQGTLAPGLVGNAVVPAAADEHLAAPRVFQRVRQQVPDHLLEQPRIAADDQAALDHPEGEAL